MYMLLCSFLQMLENNKIPIIMCNIGVYRNRYRYILIHTVYLYTYLYLSGIKRSNDYQFLFNAKINKNKCLNIILLQFAIMHLIKNIN